MATVLPLPPERPRPRAPMRMLFTTPGVIPFPKLEWSGHLNSRARGFTLRRLNRIDFTIHKAAYITGDGSKGWKVWFYNSATGLSGYHEGPNFKSKAAARRAAEEMYRKFLRTT